MNEPYMRPSRFELLWDSLTAITGADVVFFAFALLAVFSAIACVSRRNPVVAAVWLVASFFAVAVCYVLLAATFLAAIQVIVYAGAMMVLFVFVIMVLDVDETGGVAHKRPSRIGRIGYYGAIVLGGGFLAWVFAGTMGRQYTTPGLELPPDGFGSAESVGRLLFTDYLFAFEAISLLLMAAVIGAVVVARSRREREKEADRSGMHPEARHAAGLTAAEAEEEAERLRGRGPTPYTDFGAPSATGHEGGL